MRIVSIVILLMSLFLGSCAVVSADQRVKSCELIEAAIEDGADLSIGWYLKASEVMRGCGKSFAADKAIRAACYAERKNDVTRRCSF